MKKARLSSILIAVLMLAVAVMAVITVCDGARESCPLFPGQPEIAHWNIPDPTRATGLKEIDKYRDVAQQIQQRVHLLCAFPIEKLGHLAPEQRATS